MKRTPLLRKTPMKRSGRLRPMSKSKAVMMPAYRKAVELEKSAQRIRTGGYTVCRRCKGIADVEPHHTQGRVGKNLMIWILICRECHDWIHAHCREARKQGWLK